MLNLRALYGSRLPQALHPRADPQISSYWEDDTASSREIARAMAESDADGSSEDGAATDSPDAPAVKKASAAAALDDGGVVRSRRAGWSLQLELAELLGPIGGVALEDGLRVQDVDASPLSASPTPLSPTGLISIAAADIDEATSPQGPRDLDWEFIESLRRASVGGTTAPRRGSTLGVDDVVAQIVGPVSSSEDGGPSKLRFLSLLRRINEIRSQQHVDHEVWEGLPYPQILALPTFRYEKRASTFDSSTATTSGHPTEPEFHNTLCTVCYTEYEQDDELRTLPCLHYYHRECIDQWLLHHRLCPICKHVVAVY